MFFFWSVEEYIWILRIYIDREVMVMIFPFALTQGEEGLRLMQRVVLGWANGLLVRAAT